MWWVWYHFHLLTSYVYQILKSSGIVGFHFCVRFKIDQSFVNLFSLDYSVLSSFVLHTCTLSSILPHASFADLFLVFWTLRFAFCFIFSSVHEGFVNLLLHDLFWISQGLLVTVAILVHNLVISTLNSGS